MSETNAPETTADPAGRAMSDLLAALCPFPPTIDEAIERAATHLPEGYEVIITVEHEGYNVALQRPDLSTIDSVDGGDGIRSDINEAICLANGFSS